MKYCRNDYERYVEENREEMDAARAACDDPDIRFMCQMTGPAGELMKTLWYANCWMSQVLADMGADEERIREIQFAAGQRSFMKNKNQIVNISLAYANEYAETQAVQDQPGPKLADEINRELFGD